MASEDTAFEITREYVAERVGAVPTRREWLRFCHALSHSSLVDVIDTVWEAVRDRTSDDCPGHESLAGEHMGASVQCDGTCQSD